VSRPPEGHSAPHTPGRAYHTSTTYETCALAYALLEQHGLLVQCRLT
jgi:hypothetical protein